MSDGPPPRLRLNPILCDGARYCAELVPEKIAIDDWGYPIVDGAPITDPAVLRHATRAAAQCPRRALQLTTDRDRG